ncbi:hypothetical protein TNCT_216891 [Trichonephila clavata]|uniref:Uncharacterized protein n=1 Tax=Trichonephila clavata TaxID=2740835 RepID=A0A8X6KGI7_TRICU|nr:hypothetical protein TNCT_216891 [Trichonephila clavata]
MNSLILEYLLVRTKYRHVQLNSGMRNWTADQIRAIHFEFWKFACVPAAFCLYYPCVVDGMEEKICTSLPLPRNEHFLAFDAVIIFHGKDSQGGLLEYFSREDSKCLSCVEKKVSP